MGSVSENHFATIDALFPDLNLIGSSLALLCLGCTLYKIDNKYIQIMLLVQLSLALWVTPYFLSSYIEAHDVLYHGGASLYAPQALTGKDTYFSDYLQNYPVSFVLNWIFMNVTGTDLRAYGGLIFPTLAAIIFVVLMYFFASQLFCRRIAFLSTSLTIVGLYYVEHQLAPQTVGVVLVLTSVVLLNHPDPKSRILALLPMLVLVGTHPISPLLLAVFLVAPLIAKSVARETNHHVTPPVSYLVLLIVAWLAWAFFHAVTKGAIPLSAALYRTLGVLLFVQPSRAVLPAPTLYPFIGYLRTYFVYSYAMVYLVFFLTFLSLSRINSIPGVLRQLIIALGTKRIMLISCSVLFLLAAFALRTLPFGGGINLVQRALFYFYVCTSIFIASSFTRAISKKHFRASLLLIVLVGAWIGSAAFAYPVASYYSVAYSSVPYSQGVGIQFLNHSTLESKRVFSYRPDDLAFASSMISRTETEIVYLPENRSMQSLQQFVHDSVDMVIIQHDQYYYYVDEDLSLTDNTYTRMNKALIESTVTNKVYSNPSFDIFLSSRI